MFKGFNLNIFKKKSNPPLQGDIVPPPVEAKPEPPKAQEQPKQQEPAKQPISIDWSNPKAKISKHFTVHEALWLPSWSVYHAPSELEKASILQLASAMDRVRDFIGSPIRVHVWIRPSSLNSPGHPMHGQNYNAFVKGAPGSAHRYGKGIDWSSPGVSCDDLRAKLLPKLEEFKLCMEDLPGSNWVHNDTFLPRKTGRFFKP